MTDRPFVSALPCVFCQQLLVDLTDHLDECDVLVCTNRDCVPVEQAFFTCQDGEIVPFCAACNHPSSECSCKKEFEYAQERE
jgi:hypothetical protein